LRYRLLLSLVALIFPMSLAAVCVPDPAGQAPAVLWPRDKDGVIWIPFRTEGLSANVEGMFLDAVGMWDSATTTKVRFVQSSKKPGCSDIKIVMNIQGTSTPACKASIGFVASTPPPGAYVAIGLCPTKEHVAHELGHVLGLHHEHQHCERDTYITRQALPSSIKYSSIGLQQITNRTRYPQPRPYNYFSIMHYALYLQNQIDLNNFLVGATGKTQLFRLSQEQRSLFLNSTGSSNQDLIGDWTRGVTTGDVAALDLLYKLASQIKEPGRIALESKVCK
jgi:hypothetical protein